MPATRTTSLPSSNPGGNERHGATRRRSLPTARLNQDGCGHRRGVQTPVRVAGTARSHEGSLTSPTCVLTGIQDVFRDNDVEIRVRVWR